MRRWARSRPGPAREALHTLPTGGGRPRRRGLIALLGAGVRRVKAPFARFPAAAQVEPGVDLKIIPAERVPGGKIVLREGFVLPGFICRRGAGAPPLAGLAAGDRIGVVQNLVQGIAGLIPGCLSGFISAFTGVSGVISGVIFGVIFGLIAGLVFFAPLRAGICIAALGRFRSKAPSRYILPRGLVRRSFGRGGLAGR